MFLIDFPPMNPFSLFCSSFEAQLQQWLSAPLETSKSVAIATSSQPLQSKESEESWDGNSITSGLEQLRKKIRLARYVH